MKTQSPRLTRIRLLDIAVLTLILAFILQILSGTHGLTHIALVIFAGALAAIVVRTLLIPTVSLIRGREFARALVSVSIGLGALALISGATIQLGSSHSSGSGERIVLVGVWLFVGGLVAAGIMVLWRIYGRGIR